MTVALPRFAMLCFDRETNELIMQAENVELVPPGMAYEVDKPEDLYPWDLDRHWTIPPRRRIEATFRFLDDEKLGYAYRRILTRRERAVVEELLSGVG
ncbi:hypothetical protein SEA_BANTAM_7 [Gordonia phage Bantam]|uniref:Uncharacterized protein n=1 Tax=Gordonia phage Bantam TaxID=1887641 RepID=A0A1B3AY74_9CAUD|nr:hypothetical protein BIZ77_gp007 [Gordonia phage Bantam]AOE43698.1 hypothetical protein SEA_BANTAM_7 [Gordonia phage Bantam]